MLTTYDNPFNPFDNFILWWKEDLRLGHDCCGLLARTANTSSIASESVDNDDILKAIDFIIEREPTIYRKVYQKDYK